MEETTSLDPLSQANYTFVADRHKNESITAKVSLVPQRITNGSQALLIAQNLRRNPEYAETVLIGLLSDEDNAAGFDRTIFNETFRKPFDSALLAERIRTLVGRKKQLA